MPEAFPVFAIQLLRSHFLLHLTCPVTLLWSFVTTHVDPPPPAKVAHLCLHVACWRSSQHSLGLSQPSSFCASQTQGTQPFSMVFHRSLKTSPSSLAGRITEPDQRKRFLIRGSEGPANAGESRYNGKHPQCMSLVRHSARAGWVTYIMGHWAS